MIEHIAMVYAAGGMTASEKHLLGAYCDHTDAHGYTWAGVPRLMDKTGMSRATVKRTNASLRKKKLIKSLRRANPKTGEQITNLTRVNLPLLASLKLPEKGYDDNLIEEITFDDDEVPEQANPGAQSEPGGGLNLSPGGAQSEPGGGLNLSPKPSEEPSPEPSEEPTPPAVGELQVRTGAGAAADAAESTDSHSRRKTPKAREAAPPAPAAVELYRRLPERLREQVPEHGSRRVLHALAAELEHRTAAELAERITRRGEAWAYRTEDVRNATAVAITIARRGYDCPDVRCEDHVRLDTGQPCGHCAAGPAPVAAGNTPDRPDWCGHCSKQTRQREDEEGRPYRCPACHPLTASA